MVVANAKAGPSTTSMARSKRKDEERDWVIEGEGDEGVDEAGCKTGPSLEVAREGKAVRQEEGDRPNTELEEDLEEVIVDILGLD